VVRVLASLETPIHVIKEQGYLEIRGGRKLEGEVHVSGAKNSALAILAASLLCADELVVHNVPRLRDIAKMCEVMESVGVCVKRQANSMSVDAGTLTSAAPRADAAAALRASFLVLGPLLARLHRADVALPGGCAIGSRPVDLHIRGLQQLGATVEVRDGCVQARAPAGGLVGAHLRLDYPSVGATETLMMAAVLAEGETVIANCAREPEVEDLARFLASMGARIAGAGTDKLVVQGVPTLYGGEFTVIPDRIEAGTFLVAAAMTRSDLEVGPVVPRHMAPVLAKLEACGCQVTSLGDERLRIRATSPPRAVDITTLPYPGFPTDMQPQFMALLTQARDPSVIRETVFEGRMAHAQQLAKMGASLSVEGSTAYLMGTAGSGRALSGCRLKGSDLRGTAALALAGLAAEGTTTLEGLKHLVRGYEDFDEKLRSIGADVRRVQLPGDD